jgi:hypothetical protein
MNEINPKYEKEAQVLCSLTVHSNNLSSIKSRFSEKYFIHFTYGPRFIFNPRRIKQLIEQGMMNIENIRMFILDEADKLLEDSFQEQIK